MKNVLIVICFTLFSVSNVLSIPQKYIITNEIDQIEYHSDDVSCFKDSTNHLSVFEIKNKTFSSSPKNFLNNDIGSTYWLNFQISSNYDNKRKWVFEVLDAHHELVEVFFFRKGLLVQHAITGQDIKERNDLYSHKNHILDIPLTEHDDLNIFVKFKTDRLAALLFKLRTNGSFSSYGFKEYYFLGLYYGILIIICLINLVLFFFMKEKIYLIYLIYILAWIFSSLNDDGIGRHLIWGGNNTIDYLLYLFVNPVLIVSYVLYSVIFFNKKDGNLVFDKFLVISTGSYLIVYFFGLIMDQHYLLTNWLMFVPLVKILIDAFKTFKRGYSPAQFFILGNIFIILGLFVRFLQDQSIIQFVNYASAMGILAVYSRNIGMILEIIALTIALGDRFKYLKRSNEKHQIAILKGLKERGVLQEEVISHLRENEQLSNKVNEELEEKVKERTVEVQSKNLELEKLNDKLKDQSDKINEMNRLLDLDNYKLKKEVKEVSSSRFSFKDVSFKEFEVIYPDKFSVLKFLDNHKWVDGYQCRKCNNTKYCEGNSKFSRRCTKCRYDESITAFTIFHKCKFPLEHALYIVSKTIRQGKEMDVQLVSEELDLRKNTVWNFKNKVIKSLEVNKKSKSSDDDLLVLVTMNPPQK